MSKIKSIFSKKPKEKKDLLSASSSPDKAAGVRRINNVPMYLLGIFVGLFLLLMLYVAYTRSNPNLSVDDSSKERKNSNALAHNIIGAYDSGFIDAPAPVVDQTVEVDESTPVENNPAPILPPSDQSLFMDNGDQYTMQQQYISPSMERDLRMLDDAMHATSNERLSFDLIEAPKVIEKPNRNSMLNEINSAKSLAYAATSENSTQDIQNQLSALRGESNNLMGSPTSFNNSNSSSGDRWAMETERSVPKSPFELRAGYVIPAVLMTSINSQLAGEIIAQVSKNIYDTSTGRNLIIPQGARLLGTYSSEVSYGQSRVLVAWQRIIYPDGRAQDIGEMSGSSVGGNAGFSDKVNNHYFRIFGSAMMLTGITAGISYTQRDKGGSDRENASDVLSQSTGQVLGQQISEMLRKNMNLAPTIEIRAGYRFNVMVSKDMTFDSAFKPYNY